MSIFGFGKKKENENNIDKNIELVRKPITKIAANSQDNEETKNTRLNLVKNSSLKSNIDDAIEQISGGVISKNFEKKREYDDIDEEDFSDKRLEDILHIDEEFDNIQDFINTTSIKDNDIKNNETSIKLDNPIEIENVKKEIKKIFSNDNDISPKKEEQIQVATKVAVDLQQEQLKQKEQQKDTLKIDTSNEEKEFSTIMALATTRPIEVAYDINNRYITEPIERLDIHSTDEDLDVLLKVKPNIKYLDMSDCTKITNFSKLAGFSNLEELDLSSLPELKDISFLGSLNKLRVLNLSETGIETLENFPVLPNLEVLALKMDRFRTLNGLEGCTKLHDLVLWGCTNLDNISVVKNFKELRCLDLDSCNLLRDISPILNLDKLVYLNLNFTRIEDLSPIKDLINLEIFTMDFCPLALSDQNMTYFKNLTKMKFLGLRNRLIRNLKPFENMTQLAELELAGNAINDLTPLENMTEMQILNLSANPSLTNLLPLHNMKKLKKLIINGIKSGKTITIAMLIEDLSVLKDLPNLEVLESNYNKKLRNISPIQYCTKLQEIHLNDCFLVSDITPLRFCKELKEAYFENDTQIRDVSFIKYCTKLEKINIGKTSADRLSLSDWTRLLNLRELKDGEGTLPIHKAILNSVKFRKKNQQDSKKSYKR